MNTKKIYWAFAAGLILLALIIFGQEGARSSGTSPIEHVPSAPSPVAKKYCLAKGVLTTTPAASSSAYCIYSYDASRTVMPLVPFTYSFSIVDNEGDVLKDFTLERQKLLHLIVVRKDFQEFQHVHPVFDPATGMFTLSGLTLPTAGDYRIFADFTPKSASLDAGGSPLPTNTYEDVVATGSFTPQSLGADTSKSTVDGYVVSLSTTPHQLTKNANTFSFTVLQDGKSVTYLEDYLGALGHAVILKEGTLEYIHTHALESATATQDGHINFHVVFPSAGRYKVFMQFQHKGAVHTSQFVVTVADTSGATMEHSPAIEGAMKH